MDFQKLFSFEEPKIMGVVNLTPDSFYSQSRANSEKELLQKVEHAVVSGADWIDIGAVSTRPGSAFVSMEEEKNRIIPAVELLVKHFPDTPISVDTFRFDIGQAAIDKGASIINDVSYGQDSELLEFCAKQNVPYILMHLRGTPNNMMENTRYDHVVVDVFREIQFQLEKLKSLGLKRIIVDLGFGFSKTLDQNYELLKNLDYFKNLGHPILAGLSRKSMIYKHLDSTPEEALNGTTALHSVALLKGAKILRVHDVKEAVECKKLMQKLI